MKKYLSLIPTVIFCFLLQTVLFPHIPLAGVHPNLLVAVVAIAGVIYGRKAGIATGIFCGILVDFLYSDVIGIMILLFMYIGFANGFLHKIYYKRDWVIPLTAIVVSDFLFCMGTYVTLFLLRGRTKVVFYLVHKMIPEMMYTLLVGVLIFIGMRWLKEKMYPEVEVTLDSH